MNTVSTPAPLQLTTSKVFWETLVTTCIEWDPPIGFDYNTEPFRYAGEIPFDPPRIHPPQRRMFHGIKEDIFCWDLCGGLAPQGYRRVTDQTNQCWIMSGGPVGPGPYSINLASTFTLPFSKIWPSHRPFQDSGEWQNVCPPLVFTTSVLKPFTDLPPWDPKIMDPDSGDSKVASCFANNSCFSSLNKWKKDEAWMAETWPCSGVRDLRLPKPLGRGVGGFE